MKGISHWEEELMATVERNGVIRFILRTLLPVLGRREEPGRTSFHGVCQSDVV